MNRRLRCHIHWGKLSKGVEPCPRSTRVSSPRPFYPEGVADTMIRNDFAWASENRARILEEWQRRYEGKAAKR